MVEIQPFVTGSSIVVWADQDRGVLNVDVNALRERFEVLYLYRSDQIHLSTTKNYGNFNI